ncbi:hypothetical protein HMN09_01134100 [Mycena chlorophos]|uniref:Uncharacterized protein n=1 Tax=Mycena chlorophos TaxID=658473 RepID=A0A8H6SCP2_MYCCL|nr:hypothetical protein HMN09_01134100 [Mycena chlorophos]
MGLTFSSTQNTYIHHTHIDMKVVAMHKGDNASTTRGEPEGTVPGVIPAHLFGQYHLNHASRRLVLAAPSADPLHHKVNLIPTGRTLIAIMLFLLGVALSLWSGMESFGGA